VKEHIEPTEGVFGGSVSRLFVDKAAESPRDVRTAPTTTLRAHRVASFGDTFVATTAGPRLSSGHANRGAPIPGLLPQVTSIRPALQWVVVSYVDS